METINLANGKQLVHFPNGLPGSPKPYNWLLRGEFLGKTAYSVVTLLAEAGLEEYARGSRTENEVLFRTESGGFVVARYRPEPKNFGHYKDEWDYGEGSAQEYAGE
jgi:hypothetical protein